MPERANSGLYSSGKNEKIAEGKRWGMKASVRLIGHALEKQKPLNKPTISIDIGDTLSKTIAVFKHKSILRYPRLDTVLMVEEAIQKAEEYPTKAVLLRSLPKKMMYQTFCTIIDYLEYSGKIYIDKDGAIIWIWDPKLVQKYMNRPDLSWRPEK